jgi:hypothetical protein
MSERFDDIIRKKLQSYKSEQGFAWEDFKNKLDSELGAENIETNAHIDSVVKQKLANFSVPFEASHWAILRDKLRQQVKNLENLYISKAFEVLTIFLLLFFFGQFIYVTPTKQLPKSQLVQQVYIENEALNVSDKKDDVLALNKKVAKQNDFDLNTNQTRSTASSSEARNIETESGIVHATLQTKAIVKKEVKNYDAGAGVLAQQIPDLFKIRKFSQISGHCEMPEVNPIDVLAFSMLPVDNRLPELMEIYPTIEKSNSDKISLFISLDNTLVNTPPDQVYANIGMVLFNSFDYSGGINYQKALSSRFEAGIGLAYSRISYAPQKVEEVFIDELSGGTYSVHLKNIYFDVINIPTFINYHFVKKDNWSLYATAGITSSVVAVAEYDTEFLTLRPTNIPPSFQDVNSGAAEAENGPRLFEKTFNNGLFEGGSIDDNLYFSANFGLGLTKNLTEDIGLFSSVNYRNQIIDSGIGPNSDRLSAVSFQLGVQYNLN